MVSKKHHSFHLTVRELVSKIKVGDINLNPTYQRGFVTDEKRQKGILQCIKGGEYLPPILLRPLDKEGTYEVLDGKQRITTIENEYSRLLKNKKQSPDEFYEFGSFNIELVSMGKMTDEEVFSKFLIINESSVIIRRSEKILGYRNTELYKLLENHVNLWMLKFSNPKAENLEFNRYAVHDMMVRALSLSGSSVLSNIKQSYNGFISLIENNSYKFDEIDSFLLKLKKTINYNKQYMDHYKIKSNPMQLLLVSAAQVNTKRNNPPEIKEFYKTNYKYFKNKLFQKDELGLGPKSSGGEQVNREEYKYFYNKCKSIAITPRLFKKEVKDKLKKVDCQCVVCNTIVGLEVDHIKPYAKGGKTELNNAQLMCETCNKQKNKVNTNENSI